MTEYTTKIKDFIQDEFDELQNWDDVRSLKKYANKFGKKETLKFLALMNNIDDEFLTIDNWDMLIDEVQEYNSKLGIVKLSTDTLNDAKISTDKNSAWCLYKEKLKNDGWNQKSIDNVKKSSFEILQYLSIDTRESGATKGLVIGNVQSGKTANMAGLMAMAADNGFNYFIILSGVIENLRQQTSNRLYNDMNQSGKGNLHWHHIEKPTLKSSLPQNDISNFNLGSKDKDRYFTVCLKNKNRLKSLIKWLYSDSKKAEQLKILVIDDEADQASINTKPIEEEDVTTINGLIRELVNNSKVKSVNYISYTATPYANILNETSKESLYPKDFIALLTPSDDYIGPKQIFGIEQPETQPLVDVVRNIPDRDVKVIKNIEKGKSKELPPSLKKSIDWFIITVAIMRSWNHQKPISMLVHTSFNIDHHSNIAKAIEDYLIFCKQNYKSQIPIFEDLYLKESIEFSRESFIIGMKDYSNPEKIKDYPEWPVVKKYLDYFFSLDNHEFIGHIPIGDEGEPKYRKGVHLVIDNSQAKSEDQIVRLVYPKAGNKLPVATAFIVVGGNTLARGLTIEGLTSTFFLRNTSQADTLMQMGRWFGFRKGYELLPRVWLENTARERYNFLSQMNEELREELKEYEYQKLGPEKYGPKVKNSYNYQLIRVTSNNKMQSAKSANIDFSGLNTQTIYFDNNEEKLKKNLRLTNDFLNKLNNVEHKGNRMIWRNVDNEEVNQFLKMYSTCESDVKMRNLSSLIEWINKNTTNMEKWSVVLSGTGKISKYIDDESTWNIHGYTVGKSLRTKLKQRSNENTICIGSLRSPSDLLSDIDDELTDSQKAAVKIAEVHRIREEYGYDKVPQLLIYRIDKGEETEEEYRNQNKNAKKNRAPLNFPVDLIGINLMIPGDSKGGNRTTYVSVKLDSLDEEDYDLEENC